MSPAVLTGTVWAWPTSLSQSSPRVIAVTTLKDAARSRPIFWRPRPPGRPQPVGLPAPQSHRGGLRPRQPPAVWHDRRRHPCHDYSRTRVGRSRELDDLRTPSDNEAAANFILEQVRGIVENPDTRLIASLAGGRKTMGAILYAALTLAARETDRITHVLVSEPFETLRDFWYPRQPGGPIPERGGAAHDPAAARIDLADLPFVPLRNLFQRELGRSAGTFSRLVESCRANVRQRIAETLHLAIDTTRTELEVNGTLVRPRSNTCCCSSLPAAPSMANRHTAPMPKPSTTSTPFGRN